jgi:putative ABC transport system substrate-binding protein
MRRREFLGLVGGATAAWPMVARAQQTGKVARVAVLGPSLKTLPPVTLYNAFRARLRDLGFVEGQNVALDYRELEDFGGKPAAAGIEIIQLQPDLIITSGSEAALQAVAGASGSTPIVFLAVNYDPIARGYVKSLAKPGGNITGVIFQQLDLAQKQIELLAQAFPAKSVTGVLYDAQSVDQFESAKRSATALRMQIQPLELKNPPYDFDSAVRDLSARGAQTILVLSSPMFLTGIKKLGELGIQHQMPMMFLNRFWVESGGLMSYGVDFVAMYRKLADYVVKILKGAKPADLPVELAEKIELVINLKTAKAIGVEIPTGVLVRADEVIE